uniref:Zinc transporter ZIP4 n=1 Tax=Geotrypetes seraphini TaxID=260995 RepID=A0A6P8Q3P2_GEOSA|nr:zinc transporter ZIP4 isoform X1 [Geotrypetes seraphini]
MASLSPLLCLLLLLQLLLPGQAEGTEILSEQKIFHRVVDLLSTAEDSSSQPSVSSFLNHLQNRVQCAEVPCEKCLTFQHFFLLVQRNSSNDSYLTISDFFEAAPGLVYYLSDPVLICSMLENGHWAAEASAFIANFTRENVSESIHEKLGGLLRQIRETYKAEQKDPKLCSDVHGIMEDTDLDSSNITHDALKQVFGVIIYRVLEGRCLHSVPSPSFFLEFIFQKYGNESQNLTLQELGKIMEVLKVGTNGNHEDHGESHAEHGDPHGGSHPEHGEAHEELHPEHGDTHDESHTEHGEHAVSHRLWKHSASERETHTTSWDTTCFSPADILEIYGISPEMGISASDFTQLSPALIQQQLSTACRATHSNPDSERKLTTAEKYIYGSIATFIICIMAVFGIVILLCTSCTSVYQYVIQLFVSMAVGSLTGDAFLHLIPQFLGLHSHSHDHSHEEHEGEDRTYTWKLLAALGGLYAFFVLEKIFSILMFQDGEEEAEGGHGHGHSHEISLQVFHNERKKKKQATSEADLVSQTDQEITKPRQKRTREMRMIPYMLTIGDGIHNFADGLAIGAAFSISWRSGLSTSIAVLCHELPHELGDFAAYLHAGVTVKMALLLNFGSALTAFIGLYIALSISADEAVEEWIFTVATGLFIYVALADMLPAMMNVKDKRPWLLFFLHNVGILVGWGILLLLSLYEENIVL